MDIELKTEIEKKLTPEDDKDVYSQNLPMPIHLKKHLIVELALMYKNGINKTIPFSGYASPIFPHRKSNGKLLVFVNLMKFNSSLADDYRKTDHPEARCQTQYKISQENLFSASSIAPKRILVCRWQTNSQSKCFHSICAAELLRTNDL